VQTSIVGLQLDNRWQEQARVHDRSVTPIRIEQASEEPARSDRLQLTSSPQPGSHALMPMPRPVVRTTERSGFAVQFDRGSDRLTELVAQHRGMYRKRD